MQDAVSKESETGGGGGRPPVPSIEEWIASARDEVERLRRDAVDAARRATGSNLPAGKAADTYCRGIERLVRAAWMLALRAERDAALKAPGRKRARRWPGLALISTGGFGRRELCPRSDVDLLVLVPRSLSGAAGSMIAAFQRALFDTHLELACAVRTAEECVGSVGLDLETATSLIDARVLAGDRAAAAEMLRKHHDALRSPKGKKGRHWFLLERLDRRRRRRENQGGAVCVQEPNVKEGRGGLRDHQEARWIRWVLEGDPDRTTALHATPVPEHSVDERNHRLGRARDGNISAAPTSPFVTSELLDAASADVLAKAHDYLLRVRHLLHSRHTRPREVIEFPDQAAIATALQFRASPNSLPEEQFMRQYHHRAQEIDVLTDRVIRRLLRRHDLAPDGSSARPISAEHVAAPPYYYFSNGVLRLDPDKATEWESDDDSVLGTFVALVNEPDATLGADLRDLLRVRLASLDADAFRRSPTSRDQFLAILNQRGRAAAAVRAMHETRVLDAYLPEFARLNALVRADHYHKYTVDEHTLRCLEMAESLLDPALANTPLGAAARRIERWDLLLFGLIVHDIGKGEGKGHVINGAQIAQRIASRISLPEEDGDTIHFLVIEHLKMSHLSQRRDLADPRVIGEVAGAVRNQRRLDMLFVLTFADTSAVGPNVWNNWKEQLLVECHERTRQWLAKGATEAAAHAQRLPPGMVEAVQIVLAEMGRQCEKDELRRMLDQFPPGYFRLTPPDLAARHLEIMLRRTESQPIEWQVFDSPRYDTSDLVLCGPDSPGLFQLICRALASKKINIHHARANATMDGVVTDHLQVSYRGKPLPETMSLERLRGVLNAILRGEWSVEEAFGARRALEPVDAAREARAPTSVTMDNATSETHTVIEVKTSDRPGLLAAICEGLTDKLGVFIHQALISTEAYRVVDVFYVTNLDNEKLVEDRATKSALAALATELRGYGLEDAPKEKDAETGS